MIKKSFSPWSIPVACLAVVLASASCERIEERDPCLQPRTVSLRAGAYRRAADTGTAVTDTALPFAVLFPIGQSTALAYRGQSKFAFFLSPHADSCRYAMQTDTVAGSPLDTLTFRYTRSARFLSNACGYAYFYTLLSVDATTNRLDSARLADLEVTNEADAEHLKLYYAR